MNEKLNQDRPLKSISVINNKGGVGKTTTAINLSAALSRAGAEVLLIDLDSQGSASLALGITRDSQENNPSAANVLFGESHIREAIRDLRAGPGFDLIAGSIELADTDVRLAEVRRRVRRLERILRDIRDEYDTIILDCPPSTSLVSVNAIAASDGILIPLLPSYLGLEGIVSLGEVFSKVRDNIGYTPPILGIALTLTDPDGESSSEVIEQVRSHYGEKVFETEIGKHPELEDAPGYNQTIYEFDPRSKGAQAYTNLTNEVINRIAKHNQQLRQKRNEEAPAVTGRTEPDGSRQEERSGSSPSPPPGGQRQQPKHGQQAPSSSSATESAPSTSKDEAQDRLDDFMS